MGKLGRCGIVEIGKDFFTEEDEGLRR